MTGYVVARRLARIAVARAIPPDASGEDTRNVIVGRDSVIGSMFVIVRIGRGQSPAHFRRTTRASSGG